MVFSVWMPEPLKTNVYGSGTPERTRWPVWFCYLSDLHPSGVPSLGREPKKRSPSVTRCGVFIAEITEPHCPALAVPTIRRAN